MGAGGSIPASEYQRERRLPVDVRDFDGRPVADLTAEVVRVRGLLHKYKEGYDADLSCRDLLADGAGETEHRRALVGEIAWFRKLLRSVTAAQARSGRDQRRRMSAQGKMLARFALASADIEDDSGSDSDDGLDVDDGLGGGSGDAAAAAAAPGGQSHK